MCFSYVLIEEAALWEHGRYTVSGLEEQEKARFAPLTWFNAVIYFSFNIFPLICSLMSSHLCPAMFKVKLQSRYWTREGKVGSHFGSSEPGRIP